MLLGPLFRRSVGLALALVTTILAPCTSFAGAMLVRDINPGRVIELSQPENLATLGRRTYFTAIIPGGTFGMTLFQTDGTTAGTVPVHFFDGYTSGFTFAALGDATIVVRQTFTAAEIWRTDGTDDGTVQLAMFSATVTPSLAVLPDRVLFITSDTDAVELWATDGTTAGTRRLRTFAPAVEQFPSSFTVRLAASGSLAYFVADDGEHGRELWVSDGTDAGTHLVRDIVPGSAGSQRDTANAELADVAGTLFFTTADTHGTALWRSDGTELGTFQVRMISNRLYDAPPSELTAVGDRLFFVTYVSGDSELWTSDGTESGTRPVAGPDADPTSLSPQLLTAAGDQLYFVGFDSEHGRGMRRSDGTTTVRIGGVPIGPSGIDLVAVDDSVFFTTDDGASGSELWRVENGQASAVRVRDIRPGPDGSEPMGLTANGELLLFSADDGVHGRELWRSDGTEAGTTLVANLAEDGGPASSEPLSLVDLHGTLLFGADDGVHGLELWASGGSAASTRLVADINPNGSALYYFTALVPLGDSVLFEAQGSLGRGLWRSDGTASGTALVAGPFSDVDGGSVTRVGNTIFFVIRPAYNAGFELWRSDGTSDGTTRVAGITPRSVIFGPSHLTAVGDELFFTTDDGVHGIELWVSDGTDSGTHMVRDIFPGGDGLNISQLVPFGNGVVFGADDGVHGFELWKSDGSEVGTVLVRDINPGPGSSLDVRDFAHAMNGTLFFEADDGVHGAELWASDGSEEGTRLVRDINPIDGASSLDSDFSDSATIGNEVFFRADDGEHGVELWRSDGTPEGTTLVADIEPGPGNSSPNGLTAAGDRLLFDACAQSVGCELWQSRGTGAQVAADIGPGAEGSYPSRVTVAGGTVYFAAWGPDLGYELFALDVCRGDCDASAVVTIDELVRAVGIALGNTAVTECLPADRNGDGQVTVAELVAAVRVAMQGCEAA